MLKYNDRTVMKAIAICHKPFLKPEEAMIYMDLNSTALKRKLEEYGVFKSRTGYYDKKDLDLVMSGGPTKYQSGTNQMRPVKMRV